MSDYVPMQHQDLPEFYAWLNSAEFANLFDIAFEARSEPGPEPLTNPLQPGGESADLTFSQWLHVPEDFPVRDGLG